MGLIQNKVKVSQPNSHVVVKNAGGLRGLTGETGPQGPQGVPGEAATVTAGTTTTLPAGSDATVQNVGSTSAAIFNFGIPKGDKGDTGESGAAATISVGSTSTLPAGSSATVTNSGTSSAAVFDFGIPKGDKGDTGATGADGYSPSATVTKTGDTATITITDKDGTTTASISDGVSPTVNDGTLTIQKNGTTVQTFSADQASNVTANITVPTQFSDLSGTVSSSQIEDEAITTGSVTGTGTNITLAGTMDGGAIESVEMYGDTEQQAYSGKNLIPFTNQNFTKNGVTFSVVDGTLYLNGTSAGEVLPSNQTWKDNFAFTLQAGTYTFSLDIVVTATYINKMSDNTTLATVNGNSTKKVTFTIAETTEVYLGFYMYNLSFSNLATTYQLETGSTATSYERYVGGTASPNPDYPQEIQTVTGEQTITISDGGSQSQSYTVNLGSIELCKIGDYQDYIYKSGEDWYLHKDLSKIVIDGSQSVTSYGTAATGKYRYSVPATGAANVAADVVVNVSDKFVGVTRGDTYNNVNGMYQATGLVGFYWDAISTYTTAQVQTWLSNNNVIAYYPLATPTDTQITNSALIAQLDALNSAQTYDGTTVITVSGDLASPLEVVAEADSKLAPDSVYGAAIKDGAVSVSKIADLQALADALSPYLN